MLLGRRGPEEFHIFFDDQCEVRFFRRSTINSNSILANLSYPSMISFAALNGTINNYKALASDALTDHEALALGIQQEGEKFFADIVGGFGAFVKFKHGPLYLATDLFGEKEIYWSVGDGNLWFSTSPLLLAYHLRKSPRKLDCLISHICLRGLPVGESYFEGISALGPGGLMIVCDSEIKIDKWQQYSQLEQQAVTELELANQLPGLLQQRCEGLNVGLCLSGGIDSSAVLVAKCESGNSKTKIPVVTLSSTCNIEFLDDYKSALQVATRYSKDIIFSQVTWQYDAISLVRDQPVLDQDEFGLASLYRCLALQECRVALSGDGADELFCGYDQIFRQFMAYEHNNACRKSFIDSFVARYSYCNIQKLQNILLLYRIELYFKKIMAYVETLIDNSVVLGRKWVREFFITHHLYWLLRKSDFSSGQYAIESRAPFLHPKIRFLSDSIPIDELTLYTKYSSHSNDANFFTKSIIKNAFASKLPGDVFKRKKTPFPIPKAEILSHVNNSWREQKPSFVPHEMHTFLIAGVLGHQATLLYKSYLEWLETCESILAH